MGDPVRDDPRSTAILIAALTHARDVPFAELLLAAVGVIEVAHAYSADVDGGPLLQAAFPEVRFVPGVRPPPPAVLDDAQRALLRALVANDALGDPRSGNVSLALMRVGLPDDRAAVAALTG